MQKNQLTSAIEVLLLAPSVTTTISQSATTATVVIVIGVPHRTAAWTLGQPEIIA